MISVNGRSMLRLTDDEYAVIAEELAALDRLPPYITRRQAWELLCCSEKTLDRYADQGRVDRRRITDGKTLISSASVRRLLLESVMPIDAYEVG